ncbi:hypothetical protein AVEN_207705-1 [Araneus ventricosus]|uniref:Uncharacterized protein n=1 Tax=Araneus ventricosus TaxID=182803 RepID=A0A4Y2PGX3_ARAVE|nr:hypothetical protein AVEN_207705-1 [Araneus ventricosus]
MKSRKQTEWQPLLMESSLAYPRGKDRKAKTQEEKETESDQALGHLVVVNPVTSKDVPPEGDLLNLHSALFLAAEAQKECRKVEHVIKVAYALKNSPIDVKSRARPIVSL